MLLPPIQPNTKQLKTKNQKKILCKGLKKLLLITLRTKNGNNNKTIIDANNKITPPNLLGTERKIA